MPSHMALKSFQGSCNQEGCILLYAPEKILNNVAGLLTAETSASATEFVTVLEVNFPFKLQGVCITTSEVPNNEESRKEQNKLKVTLFTIKLKRDIAFRFETTLTF